MTDFIQDFKIISINVNGLNDVRKRRLVFNSLKKFKRSIFLLQETHCKRGNGRLWKSQWCSTMFLTETSGSVGGVATLFSRDLDPQVSEVSPAESNRFLITTFELQGEKYKIVNIYMPTSDKETNQTETLQELTRKLSIAGEDTLIIGGDFNVALDANLDRRGYIHPNIPNVRFRDRVQDFLENFDMIDLWRVQNPGIRDFTWSRVDKFARLDYLFCPDSFPGKMRASQPKTFSFSDHRMISVTFRPSLHPKGRGFWKLRAGLLDREDFCTEIRGAIGTGIKDSEGLLPTTRWEYIKLAIRESAIKYSKKLKETSRYLENELQTRLLDLEKDYLPTQDSREEYHAIKRELYQVHLLQARESMIRAKVNWVSEGERPTKYFLNMEKQNSASKSITELYDLEGQLLTDPDAILKFEKSFFTAQYARVDSTLSLQGTQDVGSEIFCAPSPRVINDLDRVVLNSDLSLEDLEQSIRHMKNGKSPGCDGLPVELYKKFWGILGEHLLASFVYSLEMGSLSPDQRRAVIALIPKKGKDKRYIRNWRPISMLNVDYKILAKTLAARLANIIPQLLHQNQTGFVPTRHIGDNIQNIQSLIDFTHNTGRSGLIVSLDFSAAFDSIGHDFLFRALESFQLGHTFLRWINILYTSSETCDLNRGQSSGWFPFQRGIRQGCPISPFLFVMAVEKLADVIRGREDIKGLCLLDTETKILQFADDSTIFMEDESSLRNTLETIDNFKAVSGLGLNLQKSQGLNIGNYPISQHLSNAIPRGEPV